MKEVVLTDKMQEFVGVVQCFTAAEGVVGRQTVNYARQGHLSATLSTIVICVITLRNGECFIAYAKGRKGDSTFNYEEAKKRALNKTYRKVYKYLAKELPATLF